MKILFLQDKFPPENQGGAGRVAFDLAISLKRLNNKVYVITTVQNKSEVRKTDKDGIEIHKIYSNYHERWRSYLSLYNPQTINVVERIIKQIQPDIIHCHNIHYYLSYHCLKISKKYCNKVFLTAHDVMLFHYGKLIEFINKDNLEIPSEFDYKISFLKQIERFKKRYNPFRNIIIKKYLKYVNKIFAVSYTLKDALNQNGIKNVEVIYNGINIDDWQEDINKVEEFKDKYHLINKKVVFFGGRISYWKGSKEIIQAMEKVILKIPNAILLIAGKENKYALEMLKLAKEKNISVILTGWLEKEELKSAYYSSDLVVTPSICLDTFNLVNLEAMACKKPVITTCFGGAVEVVINNKIGYVVNPLNADMMSEKIIDLLKNSEKVKEFGEAGYNRAKEFDLLKQAEKYLKYFNA